MRYEFNWCVKCNDKTIHFGNPTPIHCIRHNADAYLEEDIAIQIKPEPIQFMSSFVDASFLYLERKEREENAI